MTSASAPSRLRRRLGPSRRAVLETCFGDAVGLTLFLASLAFFVLTWRVGTFFNDVGLFVPALERLARGHLSLGSPTEVPASYPGMYHSDRRVFARNYGQLVASLPAYWTVEALGGTATRALVVAGWSALVATAGGRVGRHLGRRRLGLGVGGAIGGTLAVANALTFDPFLSAQTTIIALQATTMVAGAFVGVVVYRTLARAHGRRMGAIAGSLTVVASPVGYWATIPKRHTFTALLVVVALYALARSREGAEGRLGPVGFRAAAYASSGLLAWIHAPEGFTLFLAVAIVDLPTAGRTDRRTLAILCAGFALSLVPFLATNQLVSGNPLLPPRFLPVYEGGSSVQSSSTVGVESGSTGGAGQALGLPPELVAFSTVLRAGLLRYVSGIFGLVGDPSTVMTVFVRRGNLGYDPGNIFFGNGTNLSVLETLPVAVVVGLAPLRRGVAGIRARSRPSIPDLEVTDWFALVATALFVALYAKSLPNRVMVTVRYLHPIYPLLVYGVVRQSWVRDVLGEHPRRALWGYEAVVALGGPLAVGLLLLTDLSKGQFVQLFAPVALLAAGLLGATALGAGRSRRVDRACAWCFGAAAGTTTLFLLLSAFVLAHFGPSALPFVDVASGELRFALLRFG